MDVRLSAEQRALADSVARVVAQLGPHAVGQLEDAERVAKLDAAIEATGWRELRIASDDGIPLGSSVEVALIAEHLGRGLADAAFLGPTLAADLRRRAGARPATTRETVLLGEDLLSLLVATGRSARPGGIAIDAAGAVNALLLTGAEDGYRLAAAELAGTRATVDLTSTVAAAASPWVGLADPRVAVTDEDVTGWTALGIALTCADLVGTMTGAVDLACAYARERRQYGQPIGAFQAVQHLLADAHVSTEGARSLTLHAAWAADALPADDALAAAATAKAYCARAALAVGEAVIQVHGGIGNTWDCLAHVYLRRALAASELLGGAGVSLTRVLAHHGLGDRIVGDRAIGGSDGLR